MAKTNKKKGNVAKHLGMTPKKSGNRATLPESNKSNSSRMRLPGWNFSKGGRENQTPNNLNRYSQGTEATKRTNNRSSHQDRQSMRLQTSSSSLSDFSSQGSSEVQDRTPKRYHKSSSHLTNSSSRSGKATNVSSRSQDRKSKRLERTPSRPNLHFAVNVSSRSLREHSRSNSRVKSPPSEQSDFEPLQARRVNSQREYESRSPELSSRHIRQPSSATKRVKSQSEQRDAKRRKLEHSRHPIKPTVYLERHQRDISQLLPLSQLSFRLVGISSTPLPQPSACTK